MHPASDHGELERIAKFLTIGVLNTCIGLGTIYGCKFFGELPDIPANVIGYTVAVAFSYFWNRRWTFQHAGAIWPSLARFLVVFLVAYLANIAAVVILIAAGVNSYVTHALATVPYTVLFYLGSRFFAFAQ